MIYWKVILANKFSDSISSDGLVLYLDVLLDNEPNMKSHVNKIDVVCFYYLLCLEKVRRILGSDIAACLMSAYIICRIDLCNSGLAGLHMSTTAKLHEDKTPQQ